MTAEDLKDLTPAQAKALSEKYKRARKKFFKNKTGYSGSEAVKFRDDWLANQKKP